MSDIKTELKEALLEILVDDKKEPTPKTEKFVVRFTTSAGTSYKELTADQIKATALTLLVKEPSAKMDVYKFSSNVKLDLEVAGTPDEGPAETTEGE
jgi:hypothetical protein